MILGVTPARGGSRGVARKNLRAIGGRPLLEWTIEAAAEASSLDRYLVSTEDPEIASVAERCGAAVLPRPAELAQDHTSTGAVLAQVVEAVPDVSTIVVLQATSPVRSPGLIDRCVERFLAERGDSLATGYWTSREPYGERRGWDRPRQERQRRFYDDGNVYVIRAELIRSGDRFGRHQIRFETTPEENIDIDAEFDLWMAECVLAKRRREALA